MGDARPIRFSARLVAARVIERVHRDAAYAAAALDSELERYPQLDARERALATEIVYGALRVRGGLLHALATHAPRGLPERDPATMSHLLCAAYQLLALDRVPGFAAVDEAVEAVRAQRGKRVAGFVNAVLRKIAAEPRPADVLFERSLPDWLAAELRDAVGVEETRALLGFESGGVATEREVSVRVVESADWPEWLRSARPTRWSPLGRRIPRAGDLRRLAGYADGAFVVQEEGAQLVALAVGARAGERVLDACAGRGQKASLLAERVKEGGELWASDIHPAKLEALEQEFERLRLAPPRTVAVNLAQGTAGLPDGFDRVLVDAPCTGTGTLRHRPEILLRLRKEDPERLARLSEQILRNAATRVRPGGRVVFAVCSLLPAECERVTERVVDILEPVPFDAPELGSVIEPPATAFRLSPLRHGTDGFYVASFRKT